MTYALIVVLIALTGKRGLSGMGALHLRAVFLFSNVGQNAIIDLDHTVRGGAIGAVTLASVNAAVSRLIAGSAVAARLLEGRPTTAISDGLWTSRRYGG